MKPIIHILFITICFCRTEFSDWELPIAIRDLGWYPQSFECVDNFGNTCNALNEWSCGQLDCNWNNTECGGTYGGIYDQNGTIGICHGLSDTITVGLSDSASIGFRYGEDEINLPPLSSMAPFVDTYFYHPEWWGTSDINNVTCEWLQFDSDIRAYPGLTDIMTWEIHTQIADVPSYVYYRVSWPFISLNDNYDVFLYLYNSDFSDYDEIYNMREINNIQVNREYIVPEFNGVFRSRMEIRIGQCLEEGPSIYYSDNDGDGLGNGEPHLFCESYLPEGFVNNNLDINDNIYCQSNYIDDCDICDGLGSQLYYIDSDGDGLGVGNGFLFCPEEVTNEYVFNNDDINDNFFCIENYIDECNICNGFNNDVGCGCFESGPETYYFDSDGDGLGSGNPILLCSQFNDQLQYDIEHFPESNENYVNNNYDENDNFFCLSNDIDDCNVCDGLNMGCNIYGEGIEYFNAYYISGIETIHFNWNYQGGNSNALIGLLLVELIEDIWISTDSLANIYSGLHTQQGSHNDIGKTIGILPYDRYYTCYKENFTLDDTCLNRIKYSTIIEQETINIEIPLESGNNLISFIGLPQNNSISGILGNQQNDIHFIIGQGIGSFHTDTDNDGNLDTWSGNLTSIEKSKGYWINITEDVYFDLNVEDAVPTPENNVYELTWGNNLISYIGEDEKPTLDAIPDYIKDVTTFIIGQGVGLFHIDTDNDGIYDNWSGNLNTLKKGKGYWINLNFLPDDSTYTFSWGEDINQLDMRFENKYIYKNEIIDIPEFEFSQSINQSFYLIKNITFTNNISENGILLANYNNIIVGARYWNGIYTDIPVMGKDNSIQTENYVISDEIPNFTYYDIETGLIHELYSNVELAPFSSNTFNIIENMFFRENKNSDSKKSNNHAENIFKPVFPNPFNSNTRFEIELKEKRFVILNVYDINGKLVEQLENKFLEIGSHYFNWDANKFPSGLYFVKLITEDYNITQKLVYLK